MAQTTENLKIEYNDIFLNGLSMTAQKGLRRGWKANLKKVLELYILQQDINKKIFIRPKVL